MKVLVIGMFFILWVQKASLAPKWSTLTPGQPVDDFGLPMDYDFTDLDLDFDNGTCSNDIDPGLNTDDDYLTLDLENGKGLCFDGNGTDSDYVLKDMDYGFPADSRGPTIDAEFMSAWLKAAYFVFFVEGLACLIRVLYVRRQKPAKRPNRIWKSQRKPDKIIRRLPQPLERDEQTEVALQPDVCILLDWPHPTHEATMESSWVDQQHPVSPSDPEANLLFTDSGSEETLGFSELETGPVDDSSSETTDCDSPPLESTLYPGIDPEFFQFIESLDWGSIPQLTTPKEVEDAPQPQIQIGQRKNSHDERETASNNPAANWDDIPVTSRGTLVPPLKMSVMDEGWSWSFGKPPAESANTGKIVIPDIKGKLNFKHRVDPHFQKLEKDRKTHDDTPTWKSDIRQYLASLPEGILDAKTQTRPANQKSPSNIPGEEPGPRRLPKKNVSFSEEVTFKRLIFGRNYPFATKSMRKRVDIRMIEDIIPLKDEGDGERFQLIKRSKKILSLLRF